MLALRAKKKEKRRKKNGRRDTRTLVETNYTTERICEQIL